MRGSARHRLNDCRNALPYVSRSASGRLSYARAVPCSTITGPTSASSAAEASPRTTAWPFARKDSTVSSATGWRSVRAVADTGRTVTSPTVLPPGSSRHPWNEGFAWSLPDTVPTTITPEQRAAFDRDGYLVLPDVVDAATLEDLVADLDALEAQVDEFLAAQEDGRFDIAESGAITFTLHAVLRSEAARRFARHPGLVGLCHDLLGPDVNLYWDQAVYKKPEKPRRFPWHQDTGYTFVDPQHYLTCWVALTDATARERLPPGAARGAPRGHAPAPLGRPDRLAVRGGRSRRGGHRRGAGRRRGRVLVAHAALAPARTPPARPARRTSSSTGPRACGGRRRLGARWRADRRAQLRRSRPPVPRPPRRTPIVPA